MNGFLLALWLVVSFGTNPVTFYLDESEDYAVRAGWYNGKVILYVPFASSDNPVAKRLDKFAAYADSYTPVDYAPALACSLTKQNLLGDVYYINCMQLAIFSTEPGQPDYTPLWRTHILEWKPGVVKTPLTSAAEAQAAIAAGDLIYTRPISVLDATIVKNSVGDIIKAAVEFEVPDVDSEGGIPIGEVEFAVLKVYHTQFVTKPYTTVELISLTDSSDLGVATAMGANYAPNLVNAATDCCNPIYAFVNPTPPSQLPIIDQKQTYPWVPYPEYGIGALQSNKLYNPIKCWTLLNRGLLPPYATITSIRYADILLTAGVISTIPYGPVVTNSPVNVEIED